MLLIDLVVSLVRTDRALFSGYRTSRRTRGSLRGMQLGYPEKTRPFVALVGHACGLRVFVPTRTTAATAYIPHHPTVSCALYATVRQATRGSRLSCSLLPQGRDPRD